MSPSYTHPDAIAEKSALVASAKQIMNDSKQATSAHNEQIGATIAAKNSINVYIRGNTRGTYRQGEWAVIVGVEWAIPPERNARVCFSVRYSDGAIDSVPICDLDNYTVTDEKPHSHCMDQTQIQRRE